MIKNILIFIIFASLPVFGGVDKNEVNIFIKFMHDKNVALSYSSYEKIDESGNHIKNIMISNTNPTYNELLKSNHIGLSLIHI